MLVTRALSHLFTKIPSFLLLDSTNEITIKVAKFCASAGTAGNQMIKSPYQTHKHSKTSSSSTVNKAYTMLFVTLLIPKRLLPGNCKIASV